MTTLAELRADVTGLHGRLRTIFDEAGPDVDFTRVKSAGGSTPRDVQNTVMAMCDDLRTKSAEVAALEEAQRIIQHAQGGSGGPAFGGLALPGGAPGLQYKSFRQQLEENPLIRDWRERKATPRHGDRLGTYSLPERKTLITLGTINAAPIRLPDIQQMPLETRRVDELFVPGETTGNTIQWYTETTVTNAGATVSEGTAKPESALAYTLNTTAVSKIATWIPATDELLADVPMMDSQIRGRLLYMIDRVRQIQLISGSGTPPDLRGILNVAGIQTTAMGAGNAVNALAQAINLIENVGFATPTGIVMHPTNYWNIRTLMSTQGLWIFGNPAENPPEITLWGLPVRTTTGIALGTALVGAFRPYAQIFDREAANVTVSTEHSTYFIENKIAILAEERLAMACYRPAAFCTVTGLP